MSTTAVRSASKRRARITVVGAGAWGTTLALVALRAGSLPTLWARDPDQAQQMTRLRRHPRSLPEIDLPPDVVITASTDQAVSGADIVLLAVPTQALREVMKGLVPVIGSTVLVSAVKGLERTTMQRPSEIVLHELGERNARPVCALSGPNLATEVAAGRPSATVVASRDPDAAEKVRSALMSPQFRIYTSRDVTGVEMGGALKNIIAIGAGIGDGLEAGDNAKAAFLTRGIAEIARLGIACGAEPLTFAGLSGIGDLMATCSSPLSRNNRVGRELARGRGLQDILDSLGEVAEGVPTTEAAYALGQRLGVDLPITAQMHDVLFAGKSPLTAVRELMAREPKQELSGLSE